MKKKILTFSLIVVLVFSISVPTFAYVASGPKWASSSITYEIDPNVRVSTLEFALAALDFSDNTDVSLTRNSSSYNIYCAEVNASYSAWDGLANTYFSGSNYSSAYIYVNTHFTGSYSTNKRLSVATHEFGHALGLGDLSSGYDSIMNGVTSFRYDYFGLYTAQPDDINGINSIY